MGRARAVRDLCLAFFGALLTFLLGVLISGRLSLLLARALDGSSSRPLRILVATAAIDLPKAVGLLGSLLFLAASTSTGPFALSTEVVVLTYLLELGVSLLIVERSVVFSDLAAILARLVAAAGLVLVGGLFARQRRRPKERT
jgi:hypothetical protein